MIIFILYTTFWLMHSSFFFIILQYTFLSPQEVYFVIRSSVSGESWISGLGEGGQVNNGSN